MTMTEKIRTKIADAEKRRGELDQARGQHALAASNGDATAKGAMTKLSNQIDTLDREIETHRLALAEAQRLAAEAAAQAKAERQAAARAKNHDLAQQQLALLRDVDEGLATIAAKMARVMELNRERRAVDNDGANRLGRKIKFAFACALRHFGWGAFADTGFASQTHVGPLGVTFAHLETAGREPPPSAGPEPEVAEAAPAGIPPPAVPLSAAWPRLAAEALRKGKAANQNEVGS